MYILTIACRNGMTIVILCPCVLLAAIGMVFYWVIVLVCDVCLQILYNYEYIYATLWCTIVSLQY